MKLGIGTAQFGMTYGISNQEGQTGPAEIARILRLATENDIRVVDTAPSYGNSEEVIGQEISRIGPNFLIVTKTPRFSMPAVSEAEADRIESTLRESLVRLRQPEVYGLLIHHADDLLVSGSKFLWKRMKRLKSCGLVNKIGVSVYQPSEADRVIEEWDIDLIQAPVSVLDQRFVISGCLQRMKKRGIEVHARSIFLQGLVLMEPEDLGAHFKGVKPVLHLFRQFCRQQQISLVAAAVGFVLSVPEISYAICGVNNSAHLSELIEAVRVPLSFDSARFAFDDAQILMPMLWPRSPHNKKDLSYT